MLNIPELTGLFEPQPYKPPVNALENNLSTVAALQDPSGTLRKMQADQIANATADIKMDEIDAQYKGIALGAINEYQNKRKEMYKGNKGFNRLSLSGEQLLEDQRSYKSLVNDINIMKNVTKENRDTMADVSKMFAAQTITREDYDAFEKERMAADAKAKTIGDIPNYRNILNNYLRTKPVKWDANTSKSPYKTPEQVADVILKPQQGKTAGEYSQATTKQQVQYMYDSPLWNSDIRPMMYQFGVFRMGMSPEQEYRAMLDYSKNRFNDAESRRGGNTTINNLPAWEKNWQPKYRIIDGELTFNAKPTDGIVMTDQFNGLQGKVSPGDLFIPKKTFTKNGQRYVQGVTVAKGQFKVGKDATGNDYIESSTGATYTPVTVPMDDNMQTVIESNYFKPNQEGYPDQTVWGKLNSSTKRGVEAKDPSHTVRKYEYDGELYSYQELIEAGVDVAKQMNDGTVKVKK